jgi:ribosomal protein S18 acetylase RimI-like enzyme
MAPRQITRATIRRAGPPDAAAIARVHVDSWQAAYLGLIPASVLNRLSLPAQTASWQRLLSTDERRGSRTLLICAGGAILGFSSAGPTRDDDDDPLRVGEIYTIYLLPSAWGRGLGGELFEAAQEDLARRRYRTVTLWVLAGNTRARRFYELNGFEADGARRPVNVGGVTLMEVRYRRAL